MTNISTMPAPVNQVVEIARPQLVVEKVIAELVRQTNGSASTYRNLYPAPGLGLKTAVNDVSTIDPNGFWGCRLQIQCPAGVHLRVDKSKTGKKFSAVLHTRSGLDIAWCEESVSSEAALVKEIVSAILQA